jgi:tetratricopeptide (TPR) repeat protein
MSFTMKRAGLSHFAVCLGFALAAILAAPSAFASGGPGGGGGAGDSSQSQQDHSKSQTDLTTCERGKVWSAKAHKCLPQHSGVLSDSELADYAFALAKAERYEEALQVLDLSQDSNTPKALNYRGYVTRKLGRVDEGIGYYLKSVALDPNYAQVREYLGEAYVIQGKFDLANEQLGKIKAICGSTDCEEYQDLHKALDDAHSL